MHEMVLLFHELADGSWHLDWMLDQPSYDEYRLVTFRVLDRIDEPGLACWSAVRQADHRAAYLTRQGPISRNRGTVRRLARGSCSWVERADDRITVDLRWPSWAGRVLGRRMEADRWTFTVEPG